MYWTLLDEAQDAVKGVCIKRETSLHFIYGRGEVLGWSLLMLP